VRGVLVYDYRPLLRWRSALRNRHRVHVRPLSIMGGKRVRVATSFLSLSLCVCVCVRACVRVAPI
jgi:hypothetical protein